MVDKKTQSHRSKVMLGSAVAVVLAAGIAFGAYRFLSSDRGMGPVVNAHDTNALKELARQPGALRGHMRELRNREDLTDEQRRQAMMAMREAWRELMDERVDEYLNAPDDKKDEVLDRHLDEIEKRRREWEAERARDREARDRGPGEARPGDRGAPGPRGRFANSTPSERKARSESRSPDQRAKHMAYRRALRKRAEERGIELPFGRGPGSGRGDGGRRE